MNTRTIFHSEEWTQVLEETYCCKRMCVRTAQEGRGAPPQPSSFFLNIHKYLVSKGLGVLVLARIDQIAAAGAVFFTESKRFINLEHRTKHAQQARGNNLVIWEGMRRLAAQNCKELDFGQTSMENDGPRRHKARWGTPEGVLEYMTYGVRQARFMVDKDRASGWHDKIFSRMPMALLRTAGAVLYRQMT